MAGMHIDQCPNGCVLIQNKKTGRDAPPVFGLLSVRGSVASNLYRAVDRVDIQPGATIANISI